MSLFFPRWNRSQGRSVGAVVIGLVEGGHAAGGATVDQHAFAGPHGGGDSPAGGGAGIGGGGPLMGGGMVATAGGEVARLLIASSPDDHFLT